MIKESKERKPLTQSQERVMVALINFITEKRYQPSIDELARIMGQNPSGIHHHLRGIALAGWIELTGAPRSIIIPLEVKGKYASDENE